MIESWSFQYDVYDVYLLEIVSVKVELLFHLQSFSKIFYIIQCIFNDYFVSVLQICKNYQFRNLKVSWLEAIS